MDWLMQGLVRKRLRPVYTDPAHSRYKSTVYQSIDDDSPAIGDAIGPDRPWLWPALLSGAAVLSIAAFLYASGPGGRTGISEPIGPEPEARQAYLRALGETQPALRRARLTDFLNQHPQNPRTGSARAQLDILDQAADRDWQATLTTAYDPRLDFDRRRQAVYAYQREWGRYLGARDTDIEQLLKDIDQDAERGGQPDRTLPRDPDAYAGIPDNRLLGGPDGRDDRVRFRTLPRPTYDLDTNDGVVIAPRVVRNVRPRYPRRAERRGVNAVVTLSLVIGSDGRVDETELISIDADRYHEEFIRAAERAALRTRFRPMMVGGVPTEAVGIRKRYRFEAD